MNSLKTAYISLGSNLGDRLQYLLDARERIEKNIGKILRQSKIYKTAAWGHTQQPDFYNQVLEVQTSFTPLQLLENCLTIEKEMGRTRGILWAERTIDIDILLFDGRSVQTTELKIPHPYLHLRNFVLVPLCEIAPDLIHPTLELSIQHLLDRCTDELETKTLEA
jgi:2-amino-4-hydroxy-6-hydroxymethyldihydropteridine diphosphokinase